MRGQLIVPAHQQEKVLATYSILRGVTRAALPARPDHSIGDGKRVEIICVGNRPRQGEQAGERLGDFGGSGQRRTSIVRNRIRSCGPIPSLSMRRVSALSNEK